MKKFKKILREFDVSKFKKPTGNMESMYDIAFWNLWNQFGLTPEKCKAAKERGKQLSVTDYAWTKAAHAQYYEHPYTKLFMKKLGDRQHNMAPGMWVLQAEPCDYENYVQRETERAAAAKAALPKTARKSSKARA